MTHLVLELLLVFLCYGYNCFTSLQVVEQTTDAISEGVGVGGAG